jgi:hypothetical protein
MAPMLSVSVRVLMSPGHQHRSGPDHRVSRAIANIRFRPPGGAVRRRQAMRSAGVRMIRLKRKARRRSGTVASPNAYSLRHSTRRRRSGRPCPRGPNIARNLGGHGGAMTLSLLAEIHRHDVRPIFACHGRGDHYRLVMRFGPSLRHPRDLELQREIDRRDRRSGDRGIGDVRSNGTWLNSGRPRSRSS